MIGRPKQTTTTGKRQKTGKKRKPPKLSRLNKPEGMSLEDWQVELRRQFGREQKYRLKNVGDQPVFSEFEVVNPQSRNAYRVRIRGLQRRRQLLLLSRFRHQHARHLQAHRVHPGRPWSGSAAARRPCAPASGRPTARSSSSTAPGARCASGPATIARPSWPASAARYFGSDGVLLAGSLRPFRGVSVRGGTARSRPALPRRRAGLRGRGARRRAAPASRWPRPSRAASAAPPSRIC